ncbi:MAG: hypothetical protein A3E82_07805 [Gammaproteobacteria bacterium RIFCSPHIGHO2_12_FULL_38_11]|nr:MAG: hypothetical protein A3E82_07805 [Gammaproteobacteria bacterium RIFCSPHIGHO2_12_FULL_38_11]
MMLKLKKITLFSVLILSCLTVNASMDVYSSEQAVAPPNPFQGQYVSLNAGATYASNINQNPINKSGILGAGGNIFLGDKINPYFGPEMGVSYFSFGPWGGVMIACINAKLTLPMGDFSLFGKLGAALGEVTTRLLITPFSSSNFVPSVGAGLGYNFTHRWTGTAEFNGAYFSAKNANGFIGGFTLGFTHYFTL